jgi:hypothetical protein
MLYCTNRVARKVQIAGHSRCTYPLSFLPLR